MKYCNVWWVSSWSIVKGQGEETGDRLVVLRSLIVCGQSTSSSASCREASDWTDQCMILLLVRGCCTSFGLYAGRRKMLSCSASINGCVTVISVCSSGWMCDMLIKIWWTWLPVGCISSFGFIWLSCSVRAKHKLMCPNVVLFVY